MKIPYFAAVTLCCSALIGCGDSVEDAKDIAIELCEGVKAQSLSKKEYAELTTEDDYELRFPRKSNMRQSEVQLFQGVLNMISCEVTSVKTASEDDDFPVVVTLGDLGSKMIIKETDDGIKVTSWW
ncbi:hypothetical protein JC525_03160 [Alteromonas sp. IB21]|uniref:hypothetical protein n=1 Tax=Alteromonas sp. IB21 TaxID=2779369 RepID=UPI0018E904AF|nr:hypothetical protein [Alteromonas sp. IB21]MBJ2127928.1 hypothetical protein [Alteromonas sp. IB21]